MITMVNRTMRRAILKLLKMRGMWGAFACSRADQESVRTCQLFGELVDVAGRLLFRVSSFPLFAAADLLPSLPQTLRCCNALRHFARFRKFAAARRGTG
jgi:hypothetical protein